jgi:hypothetical protein
MEGRRIARHQKESRGVSEALNPFGTSRTSDRNFLKEHVRAIRLREKELKEAKLRMQELENAPPVSNKKYAHVESRVFKPAPVTASGSAPSSARGESRTTGSGGAGRHASFGRVPEYLVEKRTREAAEKRRVEEEQKTKKVFCPPGHRVLAEEERMETINLLESRKKEVDQLINRLPLRIETDGQRRRQAELNKRMTDIDQALKFLSKPNVLVKEDE